MKANELMIGDWVQNTNGNKGQVIGFQFHTGSEGNEVVMRYNPNSTCWSNEEYLEPIPLTAEILEKNGFWWGLTTDSEDLLSLGLGVPLSIQKSWVWEDEDGGKVVLDFPNEANGGQVWCHTDKKDSSMGWLDSIYVHELQHLLRLCGLNELADNFRVE